MVFSSEDYEKNAGLGPIEAGLRYRITESAGVKIGGHIRGKDELVQKSIPSLYHLD
jgi:hypothetical protein